MAVTIPDNFIDILKEQGNTRQYISKEKVFTQGEKASHFYIVSAGRVRVYTILPKGEERTIEILEAGRIFGDSSFLTNSRRTVNIEAVTDSEIISCHTEQLIALCAKSEQIMRIVFQHMADTCNYLTAQLVQSGQYNSTQKVAAFLINESSNRRQNVLPYTHEEVAASVSLNRVTVSRIISQFKQKNIIKVGYKTIEILDEQALKNMYKA